MYSASDILDLVLYELMALLSMLLLKLIVDYFRKRYYLNKAFKIITKRLDNGVVDMVTSIGGTYAELPIKITIVSFLNIYVDYLTKNDQNEYAVSVNEWRHKAQQARSIGNIPKNIFSMLVNIEDASRRGEQINVSNSLTELARVLAQKEERYSRSKKWNYINVALAIIALIATLYFGLK